MPKVVTFFLPILITLCLTACQGNDAPPASTTTLIGTAINIPYSVTIGKALDASESGKVQALIQRTFDEADLIYNKDNPASELAALNALPAGEKRALSADLEYLLELTQEMIDASGGDFDPTLEPLHDLWDKIHLENGYFSKDHDATRLNLQEVAKRLYVDRLVETLVQAGYDDVVVEWNGESGTGIEGSQEPGVRSQEVW